MYGNPYVVFIVEERSNKNIRTLVYTVDADDFDNYVNFLISKENFEAEGRRTH